MFLYFYLSICVLETSIPLTQPHVVPMHLWEVWAWGWRQPPLLPRPRPPSPTRTLSYEEEEEEERGTPHWQWQSCPVGERRPRCRPNAAAAPQLWDRGLLVPGVGEARENQLQQDPQVGRARSKPFSDHSSAILHRFCVSAIHLQREAVNYKHYSS